ncbi:MAG: HYR-like domain-containing protein, partial [Limisphaerales bacterium]
MLHEYQLAHRFALRMICVAVVALHALSAVGATITADSADYPPGATATFTGAGFQPGEMVQLQVVHVDGTPNDDPSHELWEVTADDSGGFVTTWTVDPFDAIGSTLEVRATGLISGLFAGAQFTDSVSVDFTQGANQDSGFALGNVHWITVNLQANNCFYYEGMSTLQRIMLTTITANSSNTHTMVFSHQASQGGLNHAYDYLTSWSQAVSAANAIYGSAALLTNLNQCGPGISSATTCNTIRSSGNSIVVAAPSNMGTVLGDNVAASAAAYEGLFGQRSITIYGTAPITSATLTFTGYTGTTDLTANYALTWVSSSTSLIIEAAGHLADSIDTLNAGIGYGTSKGAWVPNPPVYHFTISTIDGVSISGMDNKIKASDIVQPPPPCSATNNSPLCVGTTLQLGAATLSGMTYSWTGPNGFSSTSQSPTIANVTSANAGTYTLKTTSATGSNTCTTVVTVNQFPNCSITGASTVCPLSTNTYSAGAGMDSYSWSVSAGATIIGASTNQNVSIKAGSCATSYTVSLVVASNGCSSSCNQGVNATDTTPPVISSLPSASTIQCPNSPAFTTPTATDGCDSSPTLTFADVTTAGSCAQAYTVTRTWTATDRCGNSSTASQTITVRDTTAPVISGVPSASTIQCPAIPSFTTPTVTDACDNSPTLTFSDVTTAGSCAQAYTVVRTWTATDHCGNSSTASQSITVRDTSAPVISGLPAASTIQCPATPSFTTPTVTDACDNSPTLTFSDATTVESCAQSYTVVRTWTATDHCGNSSTASQSIAVRDTTA